MRRRLIVTRDLVGNWWVCDHREPVAIQATATPPKAVDKAIERLYGRRPTNYRPLSMRGGLRRFLVEFPVPRPPTRPPGANPSA